MKKIPYHIASDRFGMIAYAAALAVMGTVIEYKFNIFVNKGPVFEMKLFLAWVGYFVVSSLILFLIYAIFGESKMDYEAREAKNRSMKVFRLLLKASEEELHEIKHVFDDKELDYSFHGFDNCDVIIALEKIFEKNSRPVLQNIFPNEYKDFQQRRENAKVFDKSVSISKKYGMCA